MAAPASDRMHAKLARDDKLDQNFYYSDLYEFAVAVVNLPWAETAAASAQGTYTPRIIIEVSTLNNGVIRFEKLDFSSSVGTLIYYDDHTEDTDDGLRRDSIITQSLTLTLSNPVNKEYGRLEVELEAYTQGQLWIYADPEEYNIDIHNEQDVDDMFDDALAQTERELDDVPLWDFSATSRTDDQDVYTATYEQQGGKYPPDGPPVWSDPTEQDNDSIVEVSGDDSGFTIVSIDVYVERAPRVKRAGMGKAIALVADTSDRSRVARIKPKHNNTRRPHIDHGQSKSCGKCHTKVANYECSRCKKLYCGSKCQRDDWPEHQHTCGS
jgi:hypothetical protein